jgi:hypothetical protein
MNDKRKRAAPTIDLEATELASAPAQPAPESAPEPPSKPPPESAAPADPPPSASPPAPSSSAGFTAAAIAGGVAGAVLAAALFAVLWFTGLLQGASHGESAQIAALQKQIHDLQNRPPPAADTQALDTLRQRVATIEQDIAKLPPGDKTVAARLAGADNAMKALGIALTALNKRSDDVAAEAAQAQQRAAAAEKAAGDLRASLASAAKNPSIDPAELDALQKRVAALEASVAAARAQIAKTSVVDSAARLALSAAALRDAVESGAPYAAQLKQAKSLGADAKTLAPLDAFAESGVPGKAALAHELSDLMPTLMEGAGAKKAPSGFLARLQANAGRLVRVSPVNAPTGARPADVLARIEVEASQADIADALADLDKLPAAARQPAQNWIAKVKARQAARAAARQIAADAARALGAQ